MHRQVDPILLIESAVRMETMGRKGVWYQGRIYSSKELRNLSDLVFPLPPFSSYEYYMNKKNGPSSSNSD